MSPETELTPIAYDLVPEIHPALRTPAIPFDFDEPPIDPLQLYLNMRETMVKNMGFGLSCNQVGLPWGMFVFGDPSRPESIIGAFNPTLIDVSDKQIALEEGCLSYPGLLVKIKRPYAIRVRYTTHNGVRDTIKFENLTARVFQHELDHVNGVIFTQRASKFHLEQARRQLARRMR